jgi:nucleoid DNA-binding protein
MGLITMTALVRDTADEVGMTRKQVKEVVDAFFETVALELEDGNDVRVGTYLKLTHRYQFPVKKGTMVRNVATGEQQPSPGRPAKIRIGARALKGLQDAAPAPTTKAGKPIADKAKAKRAASAAKA